MLGACLHSQVEAVIVGDEVDGQAQVAEAARAANAMQVRLCVLGEVKVDNDVDALDVNAAGEQVCGQKCGRAFMRFGSVSAHMRAALQAAKVNVVVGASSRQLLMYVVAPSCTRPTQPAALNVSTPPPRNRNGWASSAGACTPHYESTGMDLSLAHT